MVAFHSLSQALRSSKWKVLGEGFYRTIHNKEANSQRATQGVEGRNARQGMGKRRQSLPVLSIIETN